MHACIINEKVEHYRYIHANIKELKISFQVLYQDLEEEFPHHLLFVVDHRWVS